MVPPSAHRKKTRKRLFGSQNQPINRAAFLLPRPCGEGGMLARMDIIYMVLCRIKTDSGCGRNVGGMGYYKHHKETN